MNEFDNNIKMQKKIIIAILFFISLSNDLSEIFGDPPERAHFMSEK